VQSIVTATRSESTRGSFQSSPRVRRLTTGAEEPKLPCATRARSQKPLEPFTWSEVQSSGRWKLRRPSTRKGAAVCPWEGAAAGVKAVPVSAFQVPLLPPLQYSQAIARVLLGVGGCSGSSAMSISILDRGLVKSSPVER
jgi:hypothetical protein